jgi:hypothetical protein
VLASSRVRRAEVKPKALVSPVAMPFLRKQGGGVMEVTCSYEMKSDLHPVGFLGVEGIPALRNALPFAGWRRNESLGRLMRTAGVSSPPCEASTTSRGARETRLGGEPSPTSSCGSSRHEGRSFARGSSARAVQRCPPTITAANGGRFGASPASGVSIGGWLSGSCFAACLQRRGGRLREGCRGSQRS